MGIIYYKKYDKTVDTIADRNALTPIDNMVCTVKDSIADINTNGGVATYRYNQSLLQWVLVSKSNEDTLSFVTEEVVISNGYANQTNVILDNSIWDVSILDGDNIIATPRSEDLVITNTSIFVGTEYNGYKLRFTYSFGEMRANLETYVDNAIANINVSSSIDTTVGTITEFEGEL